MVWGKCVRSLLLGNECAAVQVSAYFCRLSFQGPDWQLFLELESHSLLNRMSREKEECRGVVRARTCVHNCTFRWACHASEHPHICMLNVAMCSHLLTLFETVANNWHTNVTYSHSCLHTCTSIRVCARVHKTSSNTHKTIHDTGDTFMALWDVLLQRGMVRDVH